ncbi:UNVERIFIED_CONTAM: hypothetical protein Scaly_2881700 [Sesamum calycinum]|uniref:Uncharacterized protein n=1 Tax=Sesamum calycinum TaxID=2727403 RepID=A0AAW2J0M0_9LAMI
MPADWTIPTIAIHWSFPPKAALMNSYRGSFFPGWCYSFPFSRAIGSKVLSKPMISEQASLSAGFFLLWNLVTSFSLGRPWHKKSEGLEKRRDARNYYHKKAAPYLRKGPVTSFVPSWLRLSTEQHGLAAPPLAEAKRLKSALRNVASVGLSVQQSTSSGREGYRTYKSLPVLTEALSYQSSSTTALSYSPARRVAF